MLWVGGSVASIATVGAGDILGSRDAAMGLGALLLIAAASGAGGSMLGKPLPVFKTVGRQVIAAALGVAALLYGYQLENFRVTTLAIDVSPTSHDDECPVQIEATGTVRVAGGGGEVDYRFVYPDSRSGLRTVRFTEDGGEAVSHVRILSFEAVGADGIHGDVFLKVLSPDPKPSESVPIHIDCQRDRSRGDRRYATDGYRASFPRGWRILEDDLVRTTYHRTKFGNPAGDYFVLIDWTPGLERVGGPQDLGERYEMVGYRRVDLGTRRAYEWRFRDDGEERVNYLFSDSGDGYAVLGGGDDVAAMMHVARRVAASIAPR